MVESGAVMIAFGAALYFIAPPRFAFFAALSGVAGIAEILWALLHGDISGLPSLSKSDDCVSGAHRNCPAVTESGKCFCPCHLDDSNVQTG
jgi:hypothetical protein